MPNTIYTSKKISSIKLVSAPCGANKTTSACDYIYAHHCYSNHLYVAPTIKLLEQTEQMLRDRNIYNITKITTDTHPGNVVKEVMEYLNSAVGDGQVLLITLKSYMDLPYFHNKNYWRVIIDEAPAADYFYTFDLTYNNNYLENLLEIRETVKSGIGILTAKNKSQIKKRVDSKDDIDGHFKDLFRKIISDDYDVYVDTNSWSKTIDGVKGPGQTEDQIARVYILAMLKPTKFENAIILGANFEHSIMFEYFRRFYNVNYVEHEGIKSGLKFSSHYCSENTRFARNIHYYYYFDSGKFSKNLRDKVVSDILPEANYKVIESIEQAILKEKAFSENKSLLFENNDYSGLLDKQGNFIRGQVICHGINEYRHLNHVVFLAALNRTPKHSQMLDTLGFDRQFVTRATQYETIYQDIMRTSLRNYEATDDVHVFVPTRQEVDYLISIFGPANTIKKLGSDDNNIKLIPLTAREKNLRSQHNSRKNHLFTKTKNASKTLPSFLTLKNKSHIFSAGVHPISSQALIGPGSNQVSPELKYTLTFNEKPEDYEANIFATQNMTPVETNELLKIESKVPAFNKKDGYLITPSAFDFEKSNGFRNYKNFIQASMLILDFDGGDYSITDFENQFWKNANRYDKLSFTICNSFSRCTANPNKFRVFLFFKEPALTVDEFKAVYREIKKRIETVTKDHKLDEQSGIPTQPFWMPCINRAHPGYAYFESYGVNARELARYGIRPSVYLMTSQSADVSYGDGIANIITNQHSGYTQDEIDSKLIQIKASVTNLSENRHKPFFRAALAIRALRLPFYQIEMHLKEIENTIGKSHENWTKGALTSMKKYAFRDYRQ
ncbi:MAG: DEAD/DEAH box helicase family protein [Chromatiaceae bacterium]|nr:DEAD/DEAH box helicase family protein [Chromatiaceae bacterium]